MMLGGRYRVGERLEAGGQGEVFTAVDSWQADRPVVLKRVGGSAHDVLRKEFAALKALRHPALVEAVDLGVLDGNAYLVEARIDGEPLLSWAQWREAGDVMARVAPVAHALAHLHVRGLVHLDPSPRNILVPKDPTGPSVLIDLGLARPIGQSGPAGTPGFVAPEVLAGEPAGPAADVYALGATLAHVLGGTAEPGWGRPTTTAIADKTVRALFEECLQAAPASRPTALNLARRLIGWGDKAPPPLLARPLTTVPLCGRTDALARFDTWLAEHAAPLGVHGAPGIGKTAFLAACGDRARLAGFTVLEVDGDDPLALEQLVGQAVSMAPKNAGWLEALGNDLADVIAHPRLPEPRGRLRTVAERAKLSVLALDGLGRDQPILVLIDDLHQPAPAFEQTLAIWRDRWKGDGVRVIVAAEQNRGGEGLPIGSLDLAGVMQMLQMAYAEPRPAAEAEHLVRLVGGVPRLLVGALQAAAERGCGLLDLSVDDVRPVAAPQLPACLSPLALVDGVIPESVVRDIVHSVPEGASLLPEALRTGALLVRPAGGGLGYRVPEASRRPWLDSGRERTFELLAQAFLDAGHSLIAAPLLARAGKIDAALAILTSDPDSSPARRLQAISGLDRAVGSERMSDEMVEQWARLAGEAGDAVALQRAAEVLTQRGAGDRSRAFLANGEIRLGHYDRALAALTEGDRDEWALAVRARALLFKGQADAARDLAERAWRETEGSARADLLDVLGHAAFALGDVAAAREALTTALTEAERTGDRRAIGRAQHGLAIVLHRSGEIQRALALYRDSLRTADALTGMTRRLNYATILQDVGQLGAARAQYQDLFSQAVALANVREQARIGVNLANLEIQLGAIQEAARLAEDTLELCADTGMKHAAAMAALVLAEALLEAEDVPRAGDALERATGILTEIEDQVAESELALLRARHFAAQQNAEQAMQSLAAVKTSSDSEHLHRQVVYWRTLIAMKLGRVPAGELIADGETAVGLAQSAGDRELLWRSLALLSRLCGQAGDRRASEFQAEARQTMEQFFANLTPEEQRTYLACASRRELANWTARSAPSASVSTVQLGPIAYRRLLTINRRLAREHEVEALLTLIVDAATELLGAERGFLLLREGDGVRVAVARNFDRQSLEDGRQRISRSIASESLRLGEAILTTNAQQDQRFSGIASVAMLRVRSVICVPLRGMARDEDPVIGALYLDHRYQDRAFTDDDVELCGCFADQAAIALENARLFEQTREQERRLAAQNERLEQLNAELQKEVAAYAAEAEAALRRLREEGPTVGVGKGFERIIGTSDKLREALRLVDRFADTDVSVVIAGESGTGKELIARAIHERSSRSARAFVCVNCGAVPENLIESELFGYKKGAFTGAIRDKAGLFHVAEGGTLFLDEIGEMPLTMQVKMLRVLQEKEYRPVGATGNVSTNVRVVSASHRDLDTLAANGVFREDLLYRLRVVEIHVPPLRDRREDIPLLVDHFCRRIAGAPAQEIFAADALARLLGHDWPGNVRELENEVRRAIALAEGPVRIVDLSERFQTVRASGAATLAGVARGSLKEITDSFERQVLLATLDRVGWNVRQAAKELGLSRASLYTRLNRFGITRDQHAS